jgi:pimeloyl-ACP methyl ester carboxylesterase
MKTKRFLHNFQQREYHVFGKGKKVLYAFHGFGRPATEWQVFSSLLESEFTVFAFCDFLHGESRIENKEIQKSEIVEYFKAFADEHEHSSINLMAYSSGARTVLTLIESSEFKIADVYLFAPDGIKIAFWNALFCKYKFVQGIFRYFIEKPKLLFKTTKVLTISGAINKDLRYFVLVNMRLKQKRQMVYDYWMLYKKIVPNLNLVLKSIQDYKIKTHLIFAKDDRVISPKIGRSFKSKIGENADYLELEGGHLLIHEKHIEEIRKAFF